MSSRVLVTGGLGRLGRHVVRELRPHYELTVLDLHESSDEPGYVQGNICDAEVINRVVEGHDAVVHLAALDAGVKASEHDFFQVNTMGTFNILSACQEHRVPKAVVCTSIAAYGLERLRPWTRLDYYPFDEDHPLRPVVAYDLSKQVCESIAEAFSRTGITSIACLRPSWIMPPERVLEFDERARKQDLATGEAEPDDALPPYRSYVRPEDTAAAFRLALEADLEAFEVFNIGASDSFSPIPTDEFVKNNFGEVRRASSQALDKNPRASVFSNARAIEHLGWQPTGDWPGYVAEVSSSQKSEK